MTEAWELTAAEIQHLLKHVPPLIAVNRGNRVVREAAARKAWWLAIYKLEQVHGEFSAGARLLKAEARVAGLDPWPEAK